MDVGGVWRSRVSADHRWWDRQPYCTFRMWNVCNISNTRLMKGKTTSTQATFVLPCSAP
jgi:hypothetical protein